MESITEAATPQITRAVTATRTAVVRDGTGHPAWSRGDNAGSRLCVIGVPTAPRCGRDDSGTADSALPGGLRAATGCGRVGANFRTADQIMPTRRSAEAQAVVPFQL